MVIMMDKRETYRLVHYETKMSIILNNRSERYIGQGESSQIFTSIDEAKQFIEKNLFPGRGYTLYDSNDKVIYENIYGKVIIEKKWPKKWWQFWK